MVIIEIRELEGRRREGDFWGEKKMRKEKIRLREMRGPLQKNSVILCNKTAFFFIVLFSIFLTETKEKENT